MIEPRLRQPLRTFLGDEPDGVQRMYYSHKGPILEKGNFRKDEAGNRGPCSAGSGRRLRALFEQNVPEGAIEASKGDLVFFDGD